MSRMPAQVWTLLVAYALMNAGTSLVVLIAGIVGTRFAPTPALATLPYALLVVGLALSTLPTGTAQKRFGRKRVFIAYGVLAVAAALLACLSLSAQSFPGFCLSVGLIGWSAAAGHQYRFAAMESVPAELAPKATSILLFGGILAAFVGPEIAVRGQRLLATEFAGSYLLLAAAYGLGIAVLAGYREQRAVAVQRPAGGRSFPELLASPVIILAVCAAAVGYGVMSFVMTAGPVSMHEHAGHGMQATKVVLQSHIAAMYLPSLAYPWLFARLGYKGMMWCGVAALLVCLAVGSADTRLFHYWFCMVMLGIGWNFLFLSGTNLLRHGHREDERFKVQSFNDFLVFSVQGIASLSSGWVLFHWGWRGLVSASVPLVLAFAALLWLAAPRLAKETGPHGRGSGGPRSRR